MKRDITNYEKYNEHYDGQQLAELSRIMNMKKKDIKDKEIMQKKYNK